MNSFKLVMKKIILLIVILISTFSYAQSDTDVYSKTTKFVYDENGLLPKNISIDIKGMDKKEMLSKAKEWLNEKYGSNDKTDKTDKTVDTDDIYEDGETDETGKAKKNEKLRFTGFTDNAICFGEGTNYSCERLEYIIELRFKDGEYRFKPIKLTYKTASNKKKQTISLKKHKFYSNDGKIKEGYEKVSSQIEAFLNNLNKSILNYLTDKEQKDEW